MTIVNRVHLWYQRRKSYAYCREILPLRIPVYKARSRGVYHCTGSGVYHIGDLYCFCNFDGYTNG